MFFLVSALPYRRLFVDMCSLICFEYVTYVVLSTSHEHLRHACGMYCQIDDRKDIKRNKTHRCLAYTCHSFQRFDNLHVNHTFCAVAKRMAVVRQSHIRNAWRACKWVQNKFYVYVFELGWAPISLRQYGICFVCLWKFTGGELPDFRTKERKRNENPSRPCMDSAVQGWKVRRVGVILLSWTWRMTTEAYDIITTSRGRLR